MPDILGGPKIMRNSYELIRMKYYNLSKWTVAEVKLCDDTEVQAPLVETQVTWTEEGTPLGAHWKDFSLKKK